MCTDRQTTPRQLFDASLRETRSLIGSGSAGTAEWAPKQAEEHLGDGKWRCCCIITTPLFLGPITAKRIGVLPSVGEHMMNTALEMQIAK
jgi:hypothetical protein